MSDRELMQQALEDLRMVAPDTCVETIEALRARLAEPDDEPVAYMTEYFSPDCGDQYEIYKADDMGWRDKSRYTPLYTRPAARKVQPLTDEQIKESCSDIYLSDHGGRTQSYDNAIARAIERAHGITGDSHD